MGVRERLLLYIQLFYLILNMLGQPNFKVGIAILNIDVLSAARLAALYKLNLASDIKDMIIVD